MTSLSIQDSSRRIRSPRRIYGRPVGLLVRGAYFTCQGMLIGEGGILVDLDVALRIGDRVVLSLLLPTGHSACLRGEIVNFHPRGQAGSARYGVRFVDIELRDRRLIRNYVSAKTREEAASEGDSEHLPEMLLKS